LTTGKKRKMERLKNYIKKESVSIGGVRMRKMNNMISIDMDTVEWCESNIKIPFSTLVQNLIEEYRKKHDINKMDLSQAELELKKIEIMEEAEKKIKLLNSKDNTN
jgi:muramidase (phage lysozyme)